MRKIFITGGAGYVGSALIPHFIEKGDNVTVFDTYWYGDVFSNILSKNLVQIKGDIRNRDLLVSSSRDHDYFIHLACISNDPSFELDPGLGKSINLDAFANVIEAAKESGSRRFIYASSSSIYGVKETPNVKEDDAPLPLTDYSKYKLECERILSEENPDFEYSIIRPATVCGFAPRLRLDLVVNILTMNALARGKIRVDGGDQKRPNININDMVMAYEAVLSADAYRVDRQAFNVGDINYTVNEIAEKVRKITGAEIEYAPVKDPRSYHISSEKIRDRVGFIPRHGIDNAILSIVDANNRGLIKDGLNNPMYHNIKRMRELNIK